MPYKSQAQAAYFNIHKSELEKQGVNVDEWNAASKGMSLPKRARTANTSQYRKAFEKRKKEGK